MKPQQKRPRGRPRKKRKVIEQGLAEEAQATQAPRPRSSRRPSDGADTDDDTGAPELWDPRAGLKPSPFDDCASDADVEMEGDLPYGADIEISGIMVDMMADLDDSDARDLDWLPPKEQRKLGIRKTGMISSTPRSKYQDDLLVFREKEDSLSWPRHCREIGTNATTPSAC